MSFRKIFVERLETLLTAMWAVVSLSCGLVAAEDLPAQYDAVVQALDAQNWKPAVERCEKLIRDAELVKNAQMQHRAHALLGEAYEGLHDTEAAIAQYQRAFDLAQSLGAQKDAGKYALFLGSRLYAGFRHPEEPLHYLKLALSLSQAAADRRLESWTCLRLGELYQRRGQWREARRYYENALRLHQQQGDREGECYGQKNLGDLWLVTGEHKKAIDVYTALIDLLDNPQLSIPNRGRLRFMTVQNLALAHQRQGEYQDALRRAQEALAVGEQRQDPEILQAMRGRIGTIYLEMGELEQAQQALTAALTLGQKTGKKELEGFFLNRLAEVSLRRGQIDHARRRYEQARQLGRQLQYQQVVREATVGLGEAWEAKGEYDRAGDLYTEAIRMVEEETEGLSLESELSGFFQDKIKPYESMVNLCLRRGRPETAFDYAQRARARALLRQLPEREFLQVLRRTNPAFADANDRHQKEMQTLYEQLAAKVSELRDAKRNHARADTLRTLNVQITKLEEKKNGMERDWDALVNRLKTLTPAYRNLYHPKRPTVHEIQPWLGQGECAVIYHVQAKKTLAFIIGPRSFQVVELATFGREHRPWLLNILDAVGKSRHAEASPDNPIPEDALYGALHAVYLALFQPLEQWLPRQSPLVIVRDDVLGAFPFEMLVIQERGKDSQYLLERYAISYAYSASLLDPERWARRNGSPAVLYDFMGLGDPDYGGPERRLPYTAGEVKSLSRFFRRALVLTGRAATEAAFRREAPHALVVHLATHHDWDEENDWNSSIALAQGAGVEQAGHDGRLRAPEIMSLDLAAQMVVLSACESGNGTFRTAEGDLGMPRAFLYAGVPSVVMARWPVLDDATCALQRRFYHHLMVERLDKRAALRRAKLDMIKVGWTHPSHWAAFELVGDPSEIRSKVQAASSSWARHLAVILPMAIVLGLVSAWLCRRPRRSSTAAGRQSQRA